MSRPVPSFLPRSVARAARPAGRVSAIFPPAWPAAAATVVTPRVRDGLVLRVVTRSQPASRRGPHGAGAR